VPDGQPVITTTTGRRLACSPAGVCGIVVDAQERVLLLRHPDSNGAWEVVNGALEAGETLLAGALREVGEEAGAQLQVRPLGLVHAYTFRYDEVAAFMISLFFLFEHLGGSVEPGDDMAGSEYRWWSVDELRAERPLLVVPGNDQLWLLERAVELFRLWRGVDLPRVNHPSGGHN
jgi:ADP-ribose pyrophosphatase YjhB (NUDIX family)